MKTSLMHFFAPWLRPLWRWRVARLQRRARFARAMACLQHPPAAHWRKKLYALQERITKLNRKLDTTIMAQPDPKPGNRQVPDYRNDFDTAFAQCARTLTRLNHAGGWVNALAEIKQEKTGKPEGVLLALCGLVTPEDLAEAQALLDRVHARCKARTVPGTAALSQFTEAVSKPAAPGRN